MSGILYTIAKNIGISAVFLGLTLLFMLFTMLAFSARRWKGVAAGSGGAVLSFAGILTLLEFLL